MATKRSTSRSTSSASAASVTASTKAEVKVTIGRKRKTTTGRKYEILAGPFRTNDGRHKVYCIRDWHDGVVRVMAERHLLTLEDCD